MGELYKYIQLVSNNTYIYKPPLNDKEQVYLKHLSKYISKDVIENIIIGYTKGQTNTCDICKQLFFHTYEGIHIKYPYLCNYECYIKYKNLEYKRKYEFEKLAFLTLYNGKCRKNRSKFKRKNLELFNYFQI